MITEENTIQKSMAHLWHISTSDYNFPKLETLFSTRKWQAREDLNLQPLVLETGALANCATGLNFCLFVQCPLSAFGTIFFQFEFIGLFFLIYPEKIIFTLADRTPKRDGLRFYCHFFLSF